MTQAEHSEKAIENYPSNPFPSHHIHSVTTILLSVIQWNPVHAHTPSQCSPTRNREWSEDWAFVRSLQSRRLACCWVHKMHHLPSLFSQLSWRLFAFRSMEMHKSAKCWKWMNGIKLMNSDDGLCTLCSDTLDCLERDVAFSPPLWSMCGDCVASLLLMVNFSGNFLIYCSALKSFKAKLKQISRKFTEKGSSGARRLSRVSERTNDKGIFCKLLTIFVPMDLEALCTALFLLAAHCLFFCVPLSAGVAGNCLGTWNREQGKREASIFPKANNWPWPH